MKRRLFTFLLIALPIVGCFAQSNISIRFRTVSILTMQDANYEMFSMKMDQNGIVVFEPGIMLSFEQYVVEDYASVKVIQAAYADPAGSFAGFTHLGLRYRAPLSDRKAHSIYFGLGPTLYYRESWALNELYIPEKDIITSSNGNSQLYFNFFNLEFEYSHQISKKSDLTFSVNYGYPHAINIGFGYKFWFKRKFKRGCGCS